MKVPLIPFRAAGSRFADSMRCGNDATTEPGAPCVGLSLFYLLGQAATGLPALPVGSEVRLVSLDLLTVYASAQVKENTLVFTDLPPAGTLVRVLIFPPDASQAERAATLSGAWAMSGRVGPDGTDILLVMPNETEPRSLRALLWRERGVELRTRPLTED